MPWEVCQAPAKTGRRAVIRPCAEGLHPCHEHLLGVRAKLKKFDLGWALHNDECREKGNTANAE